MRRGDRARTQPYAVDVASGVESAPGIKDPERLRAFLDAVRGGGGVSAGRAPLRPLRRPVRPGDADAGARRARGAPGSTAWADPAFRAELALLLRDFAGRPTPLYRGARLSERAGRPVWLKREDLNHTGSHKLNNALGQALLAQRMGKPRIIAETGAGQHGVASATACARLGLECIVYMGEEDIRRQQPNVQRMRLLGARVEPVAAGARTLKEAISAAIRDWVENVADHPLHHRQRGRPGALPGDRARAPAHDRRRGARRSCSSAPGGCPSRVIACVGGGSNSIGMFAAFLDDADVELIGVEAAGEGIETGRHGAPLTAGGRAGVLHGSLSAVLADDDGQILEAHSVSAGPRLPRARGPSTPSCATAAARATSRSPTTTRSTRSASSRAWRGSSRRSSPRTRSPGRSPTRAARST